MSFDISKMRTDRQAEEAGAWIPAGGGLELLIARMGNTRYNTVIRKLTMSKGRKLRGAADEEITEASQEFTKQAVSQAILLGWKNMTEDGKQLAYSPAEAMRLFEAYPDFYKMVVEFASDVEMFRVQNREVDLGNSSTTSGGGSPGESTKGS